MSSSWASYLGGAPPPPPPPAYGSLSDLLAEPQIVLYFAVLIWAAAGCASRCARPLPLAGASAILLVTWGYIVRYTVNYAGESLFDDAYKDVLVQPHFGTSAQLLTWVVVAAVWTHDASPCYMLFGELGAMSAAFAMWIPLGASSPRKVPLSFVPTSALALLSIVMLAPEGGAAAGFAPSFGAWLKLLHVLLVLPLPLGWLWRSQPKVDATLLYTALGVATAAWHVRQHFSGGTGPAYAWPATDCQASIMIDMVLCSALTLLAVHQRSGGSLGRVCCAALALPLISPAAVLALHLASTHVAASHAELVTRMQRAVAARLRRRDPTTATTAAPPAATAAAAAADPTTAKTPPPRWSNLGLWPADATQPASYDAACETLALALGEAAKLSAADAVLSVGCGCGDELHLFKRTYGLRHITGVDADEAAAAAFAPAHNVRLLHMRAEALRTSFSKGYFDKVVALDNVYHFDDKRAFFADAAVLLPPGGTVAATDVLVQPTAPAWLRLALVCAGIPLANQWSPERYTAELESLGYRRVSLASIGPRVLRGWLPAAMLRHLDYAVVVGHTAPPTPDPNPTQRDQSQPTPTQTPSLLPPRRSVAVIGSGLAGLATAHALHTQGVAVTVYESRAKAGLGGDAERVNDKGELVDVPLRMMGRGYYSTLETLAKSLQIPTLPARVDCCFHGVDGGGASRLFLLSRSLLSTAIALLPHFRAASRFSDAVRTCPAASDTETFGAWLERSGQAPPGASTGASSSSSADSSSDVTSSSDASASSGAASASPSLSSSARLGAWVTMGQLSWVLSCTYEQVLSTPAEIILGFARGVSLGVRGMLTTKSLIARVHPSIEALQLALAYGVQLECNTRVSGVDASRVVNGVAYDAVVVATEAMAVPHVLKDADPAFARVKYQPSSIVLHHDESLMPPNRAHWRTLNVEQQPGVSDMSQLTVWLDQYYEGVAFPRPTFETWNPLRRPKAVQSEAFFQRVVHTAETPGLLAAIDAAQGKGGIYYAGSYCVYGMGLLEQAALSGQVAARKVLADFASATDAAATAATTAAAAVTAEAYPVGLTGEPTPADLPGSRLC